MELARISEIVTADGHAVPAYLMAPTVARGGAVICHGYGGCKEQMLGLAARTAEAGLAALCFDLRGHGEHPAPLDAGILQDFDAALAFARRYGRVAAIGHSLGGRLALMTSADWIVAISPAVSDRPSEAGRQMLLQFGSTAVRAASPATILELLKVLGPPPAREIPILLVTAAGDVLGLREAAARLQDRLPQAELHQVTEHQHAPAALDPGILDYLPQWFNHTDLKANAEMLQTVPAWLRRQVASEPRPLTAQR